jgi:hypothetical protein
MVFGQNRVRVAYAAGVTASRVVQNGDSATSFSVVAVIAR